MFMDEAGLPDEKKMVLKVLHPYLDECKVAFVTVSNKLFNAANANRTICVFQLLPSEEDKLTLAFEKIILALCKTYRQVLSYDDILKIFHDQDFIYMLRDLRFNISTRNATSNTHKDNWNLRRQENNSNVILSCITPTSLICALENNFNGIKKDQFDRLVQIFFTSVSERISSFNKPNDIKYRDPVSVLRDSMKLESTRRRLYCRYNLIIDESEDESVANLLFEGILQPNSENTTVF
ncbi:unnamed protein product [Didymodactylos carnosus]|uniref:Uncharacterized protein n=1 Tax=Didymodactylos carnosus TaxID=1234261 RepID=A0A815PV36_9BILA|nr:unnamed protein product [Didymodactylos carnosus]CAF4326757.1 unnamed protein product [Didymodactylos carnosus]